MLEAFDSPRFQALLDRGAGEADDAKRRALGERLTELEADQRDAYDDYRVHRVIDRAQYLSANTKLEAEIKAVRRQLERLDRTRLVLQLPEGTSTLREAWSSASADIDWKRRAMKLALAKVEVLPRLPGARSRFSPDRLKPVWLV